MTERQVGDDVLVAVAHVEEPDAVAGHEGDVVVAQHDSLWRAGGARCVDERRRLVHRHLGGGGGGRGRGVIGGSTISWRGEGEGCGNW